ncbi:RNA-binding domain-containing protein [Dichomitus squalens LYAD-421 SS1]|uniref:RNA-binding domain-containing protein n=1 Tax=Dichomitus squalens (strain LYAD-421) TaxID=732165 RepID=UPI0004412126|nr:RNA-binding domain-containing protein [Dichomitus squalens LYAD-421 SS1]EJF62786.1 RNA-binding domain-containing protein [Dichomitus squalens LYAD-421 SS1]
MSSTQPNTTLYLKNLNDKVKKDELRAQLFALFTTYGRILDVVALKGPKMKGQAFVVFTDLAGATAALRGCEGMVFYDKPMHIEYAKTKSYATLRREDPDFVPPTSIYVKNAPNGKLANGGAGEKRTRDDRMDEDAREVKRERTDKDDEDDDDEEMEIEDDDEGPRQGGSTNGSRQCDAGQIPAATQQQSARLMCLNLPQEVTDDVLSVLFQQYQGFHSVQVVPSPTPNAAGQRVKMAYVMFDSPDLASVAKEALDGFTLKKGWVMSVSYI